MALSTLKDRVQARAAAVASGEEFQHNRADEETPAGHGHDVEQFRAAIQAALPKHVSIDLFIAALRPVLPKLRQCTPASVRQSVITAARFGLVPDGQQAVITADDRIATFLATYEGWVELMWRSGMVSSVIAEIVYEGDEYEFVPTAPVGQDFVHKPDVLARGKGRKPLFAYCFAWLPGGARSKVAIVTVAEAEEIRDEFSKAYRRAEESGEKNSLWHRFFDRMLLKTAIRRSVRLIPKSAELRALIAVEQAAEDGRPQILATIDPETAALEARGRRARRAAEGSPDVPTLRLPVKTRGRTKPRSRRRDRNKR
ncbi:recombinase RecT [Streptomyces sp. AGS-58]|uniref:recombinase RecT n=1 Tax=unclassified Streptomyces TaxID=2593676 RepID=UPI0035A2F641